ncbi:MAG: glycosyltransferase [Pseudomonadota bacterium]
MKATKKAKLLLLTSNGGAGQQSITQAILEYFNEKYEIETFNVTVDLIKGKDPLSTIKPELNTEVVYNWLIRKNHFWLLNKFVKLGGLLFRSILKKRMIAAFADLYRDRQPDMIISLVAFYNAYALAAITTCPFVLVSCDLDARNYFHNYRLFKIDNLYCAFAIKTPELQRYLNKIQFPPSQQYFLGYPLRQSFLNSNHQPRKIDRHKQIITLMLGGQGSHKIIPYTKILTRLQHQVILNVCVGHNKHIIKKLKKIVTPEHIKINIIGFTDKIIDIMLAGDLIITKTGSSSIFEALSLRLPILMDCTSTQLDWEKENVRFVINNKLGYKIKRLNKLVTLLTCLFETPHRLAQIKQNYGALSFPQFLPNFDRLLTKITKQIDTHEY